MNSQYLAMTHLEEHLAVAQIADESVKLQKSFLMLMSAPLAQPVY